MVGNATLVTAATAAMPASPTAGTARPAIPVGVDATGNNVAVSGQDLPAKPPAEMPAEDIEGTVRRLNELMAERDRSLSFRVDELSGRTVITVLDATTHEVVRQIPSEEVLALARALEMSGALLDIRI
jgi:flagellar protein FlaG